MITFMKKVMRADIIKIGNSMGLRIPKAILQQCGITNAVELNVEDHKITIAPYKNKREGWEEQFKLMRDNSEDELLIDDNLAHSWDEEEWQW